MTDELDVGILVGKKFSKVSVNGKTDQEVVFQNDQEQFKLFHDQDCCESVSVEKITGDIANLVDSEILEATRDNPNLPQKDEGYEDSHTWSHFFFRTAKGIVEILWYGTSNGYYSESVDFAKTK